MRYAGNVKSKVKRRNPNALAATRRVALDFKRFRVRAGWAEDMGASPETVEIARFNTLGTATIPERPVVEPFIRTQYALIGRKQRSAVLLANRGKDPTPKLAELAEELTANGKQFIRDLHEPGNADSTIDQKGFDNPLVGAGADEGRLVAEFNAQVSER